MRIIDLSGPAGDEDGTTLPDTDRPFIPYGTGGFRTPFKEKFKFRNVKRKN